MTALPLDCLARRESGGALNRQEVHEPFTSEDERRQERASAAAFGAAILADSQAGNSDRFDFLLLAALRPPSKGSDGFKRRKVQERLIVLEEYVTEADEAGALLWAYAIDLSMRQSATKAALAPGTPYRYLQSFIGDLRVLLDGRSLSNLPQGEFRDLIAQLLAGNPGSAPRRTGVFGFYRFLRCWWNVPQLDLRSLAPDEAHSNVHATVLWPHEIALIEAWLDRGAADRVHDQASVALAIASDAPIRISELLVLRLMNITIHNGHVIIEIARQRKDGKQKSEAGRRRIRVRTPTRCDRIKQWVQRRLEEGASLGDYLFGDPNDSRRLAQPGRMYFLLNRLIKTATGDDQASFHVLRHTLASERLSEQFIFPFEGEVRRLDDIAAEFGHVGAHVTAVHYCHVFEHGLRLHIDSALLHRLSSKQVSMLANLSDPCVRQRLSRAVRGAVDQGQSQSIRVATVADLVMPEPSNRTPAS